MASILKRILINGWRSWQNLCRFHPRQRFFNRLKAWSKVCRGVWMPMPPVRTPRLNEPVFNLYVQQSKQGKLVAKLPRGDNEASCKFLSSLKDRRVFHEYRSTLTRLKEDALLGTHCVKVLSVRRDGGYESEFVEGIDLAQLRNQLLHPDVPPDFCREDFREALAALRAALQTYHQENGRLAGDWAFGNLVYATKRKQIVNIDAKSFCPGLSVPGFRVTDLPATISNFDDLRELLSLVQTPATHDPITMGVLRILDEVTRSGESYSGTYFLAGYHSLELRGRKFRGQRDCLRRLSGVPFDFREKVVVDLGCNCGGMLHALSKEIRKGYGFDFNSNCINAAHAVKNVNGSANLEFFTFDLDRQDLSLLKCFLQDQKADICFLLAVCMWLTRWPKVIEEASRLADTMLFESNGTREEQDEQLAVVRSHFKQVQLLSDGSPDDPLVEVRKLYLCNR